MLRLHDRRCRCVYPPYNESEDNFQTTAMCLNLTFSTTFENPMKIIALLIASDLRLLYDGEYGTNYTVNPVYLPNFIKLCVLKLRASIT